MESPRELEASAGEAALLLGEKLERRPWRKAAVFFSGGLAASALAAWSWRGGAAPAAAAPRPIGLSPGAVGRRGRSAFLNSSEPFMGGKNGVLDEDEEGKLIITEDGVENTYYLPGATIQDGGKTVMYKPPWRYYLMKELTIDYSDASKFYKPILPGKTFTVDIRLPDVGCGCNVNFYLVDMPAASAGKDKDYYCDAQCFDGLGCCAEFDMNEGNNAAQQITNHACTKDYANHPDWQCHKWGDPEAKTSPAEFAPGPGDHIDGNKPFTYSQEFRMTAGKLDVITTITQGEKSVVKTLGANDQLQAMLTEGSLEKGMVFVTGYWFSSDMNWLDGDACGNGPESCSASPAYISNWRINSNAPAPPPAPGPAPSPAPTPAPGPAGSGNCCWGGGGTCAGCSPPGDWCGAAEDHCMEHCNGKWEAEC